MLVKKEDVRKMLWLETTRLSASMVSTTLSPALLTFRFLENLLLQSVVNVIGAHLEYLREKTHYYLR